jgi:Zn-dependent protease
MIETLEPACQPSCCVSCGTELAQTLLACPHCGRLIHADELKQLAGAAESAQRAGDLSSELGAWRSALELLPAESRQHGVIKARMAELGKQVEAGPVAAAPPGQAGPDGEHPGHWSGKAGVASAGALAVALWKFKVLGVLFLTKGKFLLLGLTKLSTFSSMLLSFWVYGKVFGWWFGLGLVVSIYIHEMGHVAALMRYGIKAEAPMFLPGLGALVRLKQYPANPRENARIGLAGPIWGLGAALASAALFLATGWDGWAAIAKAGALLNLFNLMPLGPLDGGRAFHSLTRPQRWLATAIVALLWSLTSQVVLVFVMVVAALAAAGGRPAAEPDRGTLFRYTIVAAGLSALTMLPVKLPFG